MPAKPSIILLSPLFGQNLKPTPQKVKADRELVRKNASDPAVQALFNLLERKAFTMAANGIATGECAEARGALEVYEIARAWFESALREEE